MDVNGEYFEKGFLLPTGSAQSGTISQEKVLVARSPCCRSFSKATTNEFMN